MNYDLINSSIINYREKKLHTILSSSSWLQNDFLITYYEMYNIHFNNSKKFEFAKFVKLYKKLWFSFREEQDWQKENYMRMFSLYLECSKTIKLKK